MSNFRDETPEQLLERIRAEHGDEIAAVVARDLAVDDGARVRARKAVRRQVVAGRSPVKGVGLGMSSQGVARHTSGRRGR